jgi:hypothetical protein
MPKIQITAAALIACASLRPAFADAVPNSLTGDSTNPAGLALPTDKPTIQAVFNSDEKVGSVTGSFNLTPGRSSEPETQYVTITGQTPIGQGQTYVNTATLDGLTKSTSISLKYVFKRGGFEWGSADRSFEASQPKCWALLDSIAPSYLSAVPGHRPHSGTCDDNLISDAIQNRKKMDQADIQSGKLPAGQIQMAQRAQDDLAKALKDYDDGITATPLNLLEFVLNGKVGYEQHVYYDPTTLVKNTANKTPWQFGAALGWVPAGAPVSLNFSFNYQEAFLDSDFGMTQTKCINSGATCVNGFIGAPALQDKGLAGFDVRFKPMIGNFTIGLDPGFTYDAINHAEAVQFPIYLVSDSTGNLTGGIRYDWTSTTHVSTVGIFVTSAFSIFQ